MCVCVDPWINRNKSKGSNKNVVGTPGLKIQTSKVEVQRFSSFPQSFLNTLFDFGYENESTEGIFST